MRKWINLRDIQVLELLAHEIIAADESIRRYEQSAKDHNDYVIYGEAASYAILSAYRKTGKLSNEFLLRDKHRFTAEIKRICAPFDDVNFVTDADMDGTLIDKCSSVMPELLHLMEELMNDIGLPIFDRMSEAEIQNFCRSHSGSRCSHPSKKRIERIRQAARQVCLQRKKRKAGISLRLLRQRNGAEEQRHRYAYLLP